MRILKMVEQGKLTAEEGKVLLESLRGGEEEQSAPRSAAPAGKGRILRVIIDTQENGKGQENARVRVNIPLEVAKKLAGLTALIPKDAKKEMLESGIDIDAIDLEELIDMFQDGLIDENLVDIETDGGKGASVKVYVD